jgi:hypothetical protein
MNPKNRAEKNYQLFQHHTYSVVAIDIASVMISTVHKLYMYLRKHCNTPCPRIEPKVLGKILSQPELSNQGTPLT